MTYYHKYSSIFLFVLSLLLSLPAYADYILTEKQMSELKLNLKILKESTSEQEKKLEKAQNELQKSKTELEKSLKELIQLENKSNQLQVQLKTHEETIEQQKKQSQELKKSYQKQRRSRNFWRSLSFIAVTAFIVK